MWQVWSLLSRGEIPLWVKSIPRHEEGQGIKILHKRRLIPTPSLCFTDWKQNILPVTTREEPAREQCQKFSVFPLILSFRPWNKPKELQRENVQKEVAESQLSCNSALILSYWLCYQVPFCFPGFRHCYDTRPTSLILIHLKLYPEPTAPWSSVRLHFEGTVKIQYTQAEDRERATSQKTHRASEIRSSKTESQRCRFVKGTEH